MSALFYEWAAQQTLALRLTQAIAFVPSTRPDYAHFLAQRRRFLDVYHSNIRVCERTTLLLPDAVNDPIFRSDP